MKYFSLILYTLLTLSIPNLCDAVESALVYFPFTPEFSMNDGERNMQSILAHGAMPQQNCAGPAARDFFRSLSRPRDYPCFFTTYNTMYDLIRMAGLPHGLIFRIYLDQTHYRLRYTLYALGGRLNDINDPPSPGETVGPRRREIRLAFEDTPRERTVMGFDGAILRPQNIIQGALYRFGQIIQEAVNPNVVVPTTGPRESYPFPEDVGILELENMQVRYLPGGHVVLDFLDCGGGAPHNSSRNQGISSRFLVNDEPICSTKPNELSPEQFLDTEKKYHSARILPAIMMELI